MNIVAIDRKNGEFLRAQNCLNNNMVEYIKRAMKSDFSNNEIEILTMTDMELDNFLNK